jgi:hypothetical protein
MQNNALLPAQTCMAAVLCRASHTVQKPTQHLTHKHTQMVISQAPAATAGAMQNTARLLLRCQKVTYCQARRPKQICTPFQIMGVAVNMHAERSDACSIPWLTSANKQMHCKSLSRHAACWWWRSISNIPVDDSSHVAPRTRTHNTVVHTNQSTPPFAPFTLSILLPCTQHQRK